MITGSGNGVENNKSNGVQYLLKSLSEEGSNEDQDWKPEIPFGNVSSLPKSVFFPFYKVCNF